MTEAALRNAPLTVVTAVATVSAKLGTQQPASVTIIAVHGFPVESLRAASKDCDLLVVGSRGGGAAPSCDAGTD
jgi:nucleotide-binding universal stress UspA family protein